MRFYTQTQISNHIAETPEGFLVCFAVPIARVGVMEYAPDQVPVEAAENDSLVRIERTEEDVFAPEAMASFEGKAVTVDHPGEDVTPATWKELAVGHAQDIRRGAGENSDLLLADLVITDERAITLVRGGLREISCGYDAAYEQIAPGHGRQSQIRGNHIALVHRARCGPRCRINDQSEDNMTKSKKLSFMDRLLGKLNDPTVRKMLDEVEEEKPQEKPQTPASDEGEDRIAALEAKLEELTIEVRRIAGAMEDESDPPKEETAGDEEQPVEPEVPAKATDKAAVRDKALVARVVDADTKKRAEAMVPGLRVTDSDNRCAVQRVALRSVTRDEAVSRVVKAALHGSTLDNCDCVTLDAAFVAASEVATIRRNAATADGLVKASVRDFGKAVTPADINAANRKFHHMEG